MGNLSAGTLPARAVGAVLREAMVLTWMNLPSHFSTVILVANPTANFLIGLVTTVTGKTVKMYEPAPSSWKGNRT